MPYCTVLLESFTMITSEELIKIISVMKKTTCLYDPFPSKLLMSHLPIIIDTITHMINLCISTSVFTSSCKSAIITSFNHETWSRSTGIKKLQASFKFNFTA